MASLQKLSFVIDLADRITGPVGMIQKKLNGMAVSARETFRQMGTGIVGMGGAGFALHQVVSPAIEMNRAIGEVASLDVAEGALKGLNKAALNFANQYGVSAADFVRSSYDIQSAISGLEGDDLARFTGASNLLAKATKADAGTITDYMGTMYGIFQNSADKMGKAEWVEQVTGQTALAVKMFKTDGMKMSAAFTSLGADATSMGVKATEQMAVLGKLQSTMGGSEAGTKYKAFLAGVGKAQQKLGLDFTDSQGNMLGMVEILDKLRDKFGDSLMLEESDTLKEAFGSGEAASMLKLLLADTKGLTKNIETLGKVTDMATAQEMAAKMVDPWMRISSGVESMRIAFGQALLPAIEPVVESLANGAGTLTEWMQRFPNITRVLGKVVVGILGLTAAMGALALISGTLRVALFGLKGTAAGLKKVWTGLKWAFMAGKFIATIALYILKFTVLGLKQLFVAGTTKVLAFSWRVLKGAMFAGKVLGSLALVAGRLALIAAGQLALAGATSAVTAAQWLWNAAQWASPTTWLTAAVLGLVAAVGAVIYWWDDLKAAFLDTSWGKAVMSVFDAIMGGFAKAGEIFGWFKEQLGFGGDAVAPVTAVSSGTAFGTMPKAAARPAMLDAPRRMAAAPGSVTQHISKTMNSSRSSSRTIGEVHVHAPSPLDGQSFGEQLAMGAF